LRERNERKRLATRLCAAISARAREPAFYLDCGVPDTFDGRFDILVVHAWLVLERLDARDPLAQGVVNALFARLEEALREQGAGDIGLKRRMKAIASAFYGRLHAYRDATDDAARASALLRNVYRGSPGRVEQAARLAKYCLTARARLANARSDQGDLDFGPLPAEVLP
jgi:cytochrome b pre-mRNA-processing protein 3